MAWNEGSFWEGVIAGGGTGAAAGAMAGGAASAATAGLGIPAIPLFAIIGAIVGALLKIRIFVALLLVFILYALMNFVSLPPYVWIIVIVIFVFWLIQGSKRT